MGLASEVEKGLLGRSDDVPDGESHRTGLL
jgi:hypothetical protein